MKPTSASRRSFLIRSTGLTTTLLSGIGTVHAKGSDGLTHSSASFEVNTHSALVWVRGEWHEQVVFIEVDRDPAFPAAIRTVAVQLSKERDFTHTFEIENLEADTTYYFRPVSRADQRLLIGETGRFQTAPSTPRKISFVVSADMLAQYQPFRLFDTMLEQKPEFFIHLGDTMYADHPNPRNFLPSLRHYRYKHGENRGDSRIQKFMSVVPTFAIWDDHEVQDNFDRTHQGLSDGRQAFIEWWPRRADSPTQLYRQFSWGPLVDFFMLDTRQYRSPASAASGSDKTMLGATQKEWLKNGLRASKAPLKIILSPSPFNGKSDMDSWAGYVDERHELDEFITTHQIARVVVISGDWHVAIDMSKISTSLDEIVVGPIAAWPQYQMNPIAARLLPQSPRFRLRHVGDAFNFGYVQIEATATGAKLTLDVIDIDGKVRFSKVVES